MCLPVRITTAFVAGEGHETYVSEHMGPEAIRTGAKMVATNPGALKNSPLHGRRELVFRSNVRVPLDNREPFDIADNGRQLGSLIGDCAAKYFAPLVSDE